jgi:hypothetical protein
MGNPLANLKALTIDAAGVDDWAAELAQPFDDLPDFDLKANPEIKPHLRIAGDQSYISTPTRRLFVDYRSNPDAYRHLKRLPKEGQSLHGLISGKYAAWDMVPAIIERTGDTIADLYIATLGFSRQNGADLCALLDDRRIRRVSLICSHYFKATSGPIYDAVIPELMKRGQRVVAMRSHCKIILARLKGGARYVLETSANLRSCVNVEQFVLTRCAKLYTRHRRWMEREVLIHAPRVKAAA